MWRTDRSSAARLLGELVLVVRMVESVARPFATAAPGEDRPQCLRMFGSDCGKQFEEGSGARRQLARPSQRKGNVGLVYEGMVFHQLQDQLRGIVRVIFE